ncbi:unnamed protein product [Malus baccata var. baccata]
MAINSVKIEGLLGMITVKLHEDNFVKWSYQFSSVLRGYDLFDFFNGESQCPPKYCITAEGGVTKEISQAYKQWIQQDLALLSLLIATLSDEVMDHVIGCKTAQEAWEKLHERFASISVVRVNQLKTEFHTAQKGSDSVDKFLFRLKAIKDQLVAAGEKITDNDLMIAVLSGLPPEFEVIKTIILARDTFISLKDFRAQLIGVEGSFETRMNNLAGTMSAMYVNGGLPNGQGGQGSYQNFEQGESSNAQKLNGPGNFNGGSGFAANGGRSFQQRSNFNNNSNRRNNGNFNNSRSYSNFGNRSSGFSDSNGSGGGFNGSVDNQKGSYGSSSNFSSGSGFNQGSSWHGNTNYKYGISPECQICSRRGHTAPNCYYRTDSVQGNFKGPIFCQICGKKGHTAIQCYHRNNYSYQGPPPPQSLNPTPVGMAAQTSNVSQASQNVHGFSNADTWVVDKGATHHMTAHLEHLNQATPYNGDSKITIGNGEGQGNPSDFVPRKE